MNTNTFYKRVFKLMCTGNYATRADAIAELQSRATDARSRRAHAARVAKAAQASPPPPDAPETAFSRPSKSRGWADDYDNY
jgi:hypothetical protein